MTLSTLALDSRPWWHVMHRLVLASPLSTVAPPGKVTLATAGSA
jgi:hypothetical protein